MVQSAAARQGDDQRRLGCADRRPRSRAERDRAGALRHNAVGRRGLATVARDTSLPRDGHFIRLVWRARQLRYGRDGPSPGHVPA